MVSLADISTYAKNGASCDHEKDWGYPATSDGWYRIHNGIRAELVKLKVCLEKVASAPLQEWQVACLQAYWAGHTKSVGIHHEHEDKLFMPMLEERVTLPSKLEADHAVLMQMLNEVGTQMNDLKAGGYVTAVRTAHADYKAVMEAHLKEEEAICVPLMRAYLEPGNVGKKVAVIMKALDPMVMGMFVHHQGSKAGFKKFMAQQGIPSFVWYLDFKSKRVLYRKEMETQVQAILQGKPAEKAYTSKAALPLAINCGEFAWQVPPYPDHKYP